VWTTQRFTASVQADYAKLVAQLTGGQVERLVGFSGGAWVAYGVAQQLPQVPVVVTVAGNLNPNLINRHHRVPALEVAPWPTPRRDLSLTMLWGAKDTTIPAPLAARMAAETVAGCRHTQVVPGTTHVKGWAAWWATHSATVGAPCGDFPASRLQGGAE
jgi:pimeloyl-ACP methyl ester carboxylesterase